MKRILLLTACLAFATLLSAQTPQRDGHQRGKEKKERIVDIITDLTPQQKARVDAITQRSAKNVERYRSQLDAIRDSIRVLMASKDDQSAKLFPLYDREGRMQAELSKEYYRTKVSIDAILTPAQYQRMQESMAEKRQKRQSGKHRPQLQGGK